MLVTIRCTCFTNLHYYTYIFAIHSHVLKCSFYRATANAYARSCNRHLSVCPSACLSNAWIVTKRNNSLSPYHTAISSLLRPSFVVLSLARRLDHITQPPLASGAAKDHFQDCGPRMEMHPRRSTSIFARILRAGGERSRRSSTAAGINWMCRPQTCQEYRRR